MTALNLKNLVQWFQREKRDLPWRDNPSPYAVWVSEVMLQQTQVKTVIPYFYRWMEQFPTIKALAQAPEDRVIKAWEGLGYYSRARRLHEGAKTCVKYFKGELPQTPEDLQKIKGIGPYTQGALLSFAYHQKAAAIDGNVLRVFSRLLALEKDISQSHTKKEIEASLLASLPQKEPWIAMEAVIELGALICIKKPLCQICPLASECLALRYHKTHELPLKKKGPSTLKLIRPTLLLLAPGHILLKKESLGKVMAGLWEFPYFQDTLPTHFASLSLEKALPLPPVTHSFTRYHATLLPYRLTLTTRPLIENYTWVPLSQLKEIPFSSGHRKLLSFL